MATEPVHPPGCDCPKYGCTLRRKSVQVSPAGMARHNRIAPAPHRYNQWEKGIAGEDRPGGTRMPYLDPSGDVIGVKPFAEGKHRKGMERLKERRAAAANTKD